VTQDGDGRAGVDDDLASPEQLAATEALIDDWLTQQLDANPLIEAVEKQSELLTSERRWFVRVTGEEKDRFTIWFVLRQRTLHYETYVMPAPVENQAALFEHLLRRNERLRGAAFAIGAEDAVYLVGELGVSDVDRARLDRILGSLYAYVELCFRPAMRIGFASRFRG
jgi:hypothetical protein